MNRNQKRGYRNLSPLRKFLKRFPDEVNKSIRPVMEDTARKIHEDMEALTPERTGQAISKQDYKVGADGMSAKIGIRTPARTKKAFYFAFLDSGTKGSAKNNVPAMPALHIRERAFDANKSGALKGIRAQVDKVLERITNRD